MKSKWTALCLFLMLFLPGCSGGSADNDKIDPSDEGEPIMTPEEEEKESDLNT
jgi:hypothetical protein